jgi:hypothetical protein
MIIGFARFAIALAAAATVPSDAANDRMRVIASDTLSSVMVDYCREAAPTRADGVTAAWKRWQLVSQIDALRAALGPEAVAAIEAAMADQRGSTRDTLVKLGPADVVCAQVPATWTQSSFDMRTAYPLAYPVTPTAAAPAASPSPAKTVAAKTPASPAKRGTGLAQTQIEAIVSSWYEGYVGIQYTLTETAYLLLKDGTVRKGLPQVGPGEFDIAADRAQSPKLWGQWRKSGAVYSFSFPGDKTFSTPRNAQVRARSKTGLTLNNTYQTSSGYQIVGGAGSFSFRKLALKSDGRFSRANWGFTGGTTGIGETTVVAGTTWDDKGSVTTVTGEGAAMRGGNMASNGTTDADLGGTYRIDGYELILTFESGKRETHFFWVRDDQKMIGIDDDAMIIPKP